jgi:hypothetical protein
VNLPLLFGILIYLFILISLTAWLTKYHRCQDHGINLSDPKKPTEGKFTTNPEFENSSLKDSGTTTSGNDCTVQDDQGGAKN